MNCWLWAAKVDVVDEIWTKKLLVRSVSHHWNSCNVVAQQASDHDWPTGQIQTERVDVHLCQSRCKRPHL